MKSPKKISKMKFFYTASYLLNFLNYFYIFMLHIFLYKWNVFKPKTSLETLLNKLFMFYK